MLQQMCCLVLTHGKKETLIQGPLTETHPDADSGPQHWRRGALTASPLLATARLHRTLSWKLSSIKWQSKSNKDNKVKLAQRRREPVPWCPPCISQPLQAVSSLVFSDVFSPFILSILEFPWCTGCVWRCSEASSAKAQSPQGVITRFHPEHHLPAQENSPHRGVCERLQSLN